MPIYTYRQENSWGIYLSPVLIVVKAPDVEQANKMAQEYGVYFDGVDHMRDCACCGDRWNRPDGESDIETVKEWVDELKKGLDGLFGVAWEGADEGEVMLLILTEQGVTPYYRGDLSTVEVDFSPLEE